MKPLVALLGVLVLPVPLGAQDAENPKSPDAYQIFADDAGTWDAVVKMYFQGPNGPAMESSGVETNELVGGGKSSRTSFKYKTRDKEFQGYGIIGYDSRLKEYVEMWVDNFTTIPTLLKGTYDADKRTLTMTGVVVDGAGNEIKQKQVTTYVDGETKTFVIYIVVDAGGEPREIKLMDMTAKKRRSGT